MPEPSLRHGLTLRVLAAHVANLAYDTWLEEDTRSLAQAVVVDHQGDIGLRLPRIARAVFKYNSNDDNYYRLTTARHGVVAQDGNLPSQAAAPPPDTLRLSNGFVGGRPVRIVALRIAPSETRDTAVLEVAETLNKRSSLTSRILLEMAAPQLALVLIAVVFAWSAVRTGLKPLTTLAHAIEYRGDQLAPVPEVGLPREALVLARRINQLLARQERALQAQRRFVADAAHQLRTPLATILLHAERAERATGDEARQELRGLHTAVARAARLSHQLLALARAEPEAAANLALTPLDLAAVARAEGEDWVAPALERGIDFGFLAPGGPVMINGHQGLLGELISNLIDNALRYCPHGSKVTLAVIAEPAPTLSVEDDGPGIPAESRERVFERFYRGSHSSGEGCGLGLAIVREIATAHGATVQVLPGQEGRGVCFLVRFPPA